VQSLVRQRESAPALRVYTQAIDKQKRSAHSKGDIEMVVVLLNQAEGQVELSLVT
jgi:hypothetical protein